MWQRFTERARRAILMAQEEAVRLHSEQVTTEHLLVALLSESDSPATQFLQAPGLSADTVRQVLASRPPTPVPKSVRLSEEMKNLLTGAAQIAKELRHNDIDSHHLLLALLSSPISSVAVLLKPIQRSPQDLQVELLAQLKGYRPPRKLDDDLPSGPTGRSLFQRFTERSRRVILLAQEEAHRMKSGYVGPEHLLLGLLSEGEGIAAYVLTRMSVNLDDARHMVQSQAEQKEYHKEFELSLYAKRVLELSGEEARGLRHNYIGTEHLLLAMLHPECGLALLFKKLDLRPEDVRKRVLEYLN